MLKFTIKTEDKHSKARLGEITTFNGKITTPCFVPVATYGAVRTLDPEELKEIRVEAVLANTYHLFERPGADLVKECGGIHKFMNWNGPMLTDSGGFQVFSLGKGIEHGVGKIGFFPGLSVSKIKRISDNKNRFGNVKVAEEGVTFRSYLNGKVYEFTPEFSIKIQEKLGADLIFAFDECTSPLDSYNYTKLSMERTHRWAKRCIEAKTREDQGLFGIIQGGRYKRLRIKSTKFISSLPFFGIGIGGALGRTKREMRNVLLWVSENIDRNKPAHLLGIGQPEDVLLGVEYGMDLFDCVFPTRLARHGVILTKNGKVNLLNSKYKRDFSNLAEHCKCKVCKRFSKAYLHHLFKSKEILAHRLATYHNLYFMVEFINEIREAIKLGRFLEYKRDFLRNYKTRSPKYDSF
ncbi:tRNA guanosine(34) transglycosylase Tgt [bacterium]|nr:tRNA guanosine(34) transglycosylase Tgt [bacterium]